MTTCTLCKCIHARLYMFRLLGLWTPRCLTGADINACLFYHSASVQAVRVLL